MNKFLNLSSINSVSLDTPLYKNAINLKKDALVLAEKRKSYGSATSLLILSSEEIVKATLVFLHSKNYHVYKIQGAKKFFSDHKIRHQIAQLIEMGAGFINSIDLWEKEKPVKVFNTKSTFFNTIANGIIDLAKASKPLIQSIDRIKKIEEFNVLKNKGFYVDYRDGLITPKQTINEVLFNETKIIVERIFLFYKGVKILHHPSLNKHLPKEEIEKYQNDLRLFVNDALKGFSFN